MHAQARLIVSLSSLTAFVPFSIDTYLPSLPQIAEDLTTSAAQVRLPTVMVGEVETSASFNAHTLELKAGDADTRKMKPCWALIPSVGR
jgi:hypothetical protein